MHFSFVLPARLQAADPINISGAAIAAIPNETYTGSALKPPLTVTYGGNTLVKGTDYTVEWSNNIDAGPATVTINGTGNYTAVQSATFTIQQKTIAASELAIAPVSAQTYTGLAFEPTLTVTEGANTLTLTQDYSVTYGNNTNAGTASATVTITDTGNYTGSASTYTTFTILPRDISEATVDPIPAETYTGATITPELTVTYGGNTLAKDTDYTVEWSSNVNAGPATLTVNGTGNYTGSLEVPFEIEKADQTIDFPDVPIPLLLSGGSYTLQATATSGLPVTYTSSNLDIADVDGATLLLKQAGTVTVTAIQTGDENYNPAPDVSRQVIIAESGNVNVLYAVVLDADGAEIDSVKGRYVMGCNNNFVNVVVTPEDHTARVYYNDDHGNTFTVTMSEAGVGTVTYTVSSGTNTGTYTMEIAKPFVFNDVVQMRWNNTLTVINNPDNNGGFNFTSFAWYGNNRFLTDGQSFSAGNTGQYLDPAVSYHVELTAKEYNGTLPSCPSVIESRQIAATTAYPNPVPKNSFVFVEIDGDETQLDHAEIEIFNLVGVSMGRVKVTGRITPVSMSSLPTGMYLLNLRGKNKWSEIIKVVVQ
ncbi:MAG: T9SS type A sorting domain-containing protein [Prevotellaceae bacterium]|nr:T9SS type A sorting domain-containing protein [Prevotellaceae bacterium]